MYFVFNYLWNNIIFSKTSFMNINGPNDLYSFLVGNGLVGICPESQNLVACMDILVRMCACDPPQARTARWNQCIQNYMAFITSKSQSLKGVLLSKTNDNRISFYLNKQIITEIKH